MENVDNEIQEILEYLDKLEDFSLPEYKELPSIPLYMEQVVGYICELLGPLSKNGDTVITPFMINNYVKAKIISSPVQKKYDKNQIADLIVISLLKNVSSMKDLSALIKVDLSNEKGNGENGKLYSYCKEVDDDVIKQATENLKTQLEAIVEKDEDDEEKMSKLAALSVKLYIRSAVEKILADIITDKIYNASFKSLEVEKENKKEEELKKKKINEEANKLKKAG